MAESHYDSKARANTSCRTALNKFHNRAKRALLNEFVDAPHRLLDLACGRGGDVHKWLAAGIREVVGLDVSAQSVAEATRRFEATHSDLQYHFSKHDLTRPWTSPKKFGVVTCMFALHYFWGSEQDASMLLRTVADALDVGGVFIGIVPDGQRVNECIKYGPFDNGVMSITALWDGQPQCFGSAYTCCIESTVTQNSKVHEFLVYSNVLETLARMHGLEALPIRSREFVGTDRSCFHHLAPPYSGPHATSSRMYAAFAFRKTGK